MTSWNYTIIEIHQGQTYSAIKVNHKKETCKLVKANLSKEKQKAIANNGLELSSHTVLVSEQNSVFPLFDIYLMKSVICFFNWNVSFTKLDETLFYLLNLM